MNHNQAPLLAKLMEYADQRLISGHVPGHKSGKGLPAGAEVLREIMTIDMTEISGLDDLHEPEGVIQEAQRLAADCFGADETFFLVNGSTVGNLAVILTLCKRGDLIIVQRDAHKSVLNGLALAGAKAVFIPPLFDPDAGLPAGINLALLEKALMLYPEAKGVFLTNPNYYGLGADLASAARLVHRFSMPLVVDEAHGAHFGFHAELPASALSCGADAVIQSTHKMLTALTMGAMLHVQGDRMDRALLKHRLSMLQSSSPSYPIMASLDASRLLLQTEGSVRLTQGLRAVAYVREQADRLTGIRMLKKTSLSYYATKDPFKIVLTDITGTIGGFGLRDELEQHGVMVEMADSQNVLIVFTLSSDLKDAERLSELLHVIDSRLPKSSHRVNVGPYYNLYEGTISEPVIFDIQTNNETETVPIERSAGRIAGEPAIPYPPGIPIVFPGERISPSIASYLTELSRAGAHIQGLADPTRKTIRVFHHE